MLDTANRPEYRDLSPKQIVPRLADDGVYLASESTIYRILHAEDALHHREPSRPRSVSGPREHIATGPCEVFSWDITYLRSAVRGAFYYLYLVEDIWSRKIVGWAVHEEESMDLAARLIDDTATRLGCDLSGLVLHSDNGGPMKGSTMLATLQRLGIVPSFSRPHVSDDNPYSEALFRMLKYRPEYPRGAFARPGTTRSIFTVRSVSWPQRIATRDGTKPSLRCGDEPTRLPGGEILNAGRVTPESGNGSMSSSCYFPPSFSQPEQRLSYWLALPPAEYARNPK